MMLIPRRNNRFDVFDSFFGDDSFFNNNQANLMKADIKEKKDSYVIEMDLPGFDKKNISLSLNDGYLEVSAKTVKEENSCEDEEKYIRQERYYGECSRSFYVGDKISEEEIDAEFKNGILKVVVPKKEESEELPEVKKIEIK